MFILRKTHFHRFLLHFWFELQWTVGFFSPHLCPALYYYRKKKKKVLLSFFFLFVLFLLCQYMTGCVPDPEAPQLWGSCRTKAELWLVLMMETLKCWPVLCLRDVFIVPIVTSPDQRCHVSLCSPRVSVNTAPRGHDYSFSPLSASAPLFVHLPPPSVHLFLELVI